MGMFDRIRNPFEKVVAKIENSADKAVMFAGIFAASIGSLEAQTGGQLEKYTPEVASEYASKLENTGGGSYKFTTGKEIAFSSESGYVYTEKNNDEVTVYIDSDKDGDLDMVTHKNREGQFEQDFDTEAYTADQYGKVSAKDQAQVVYVNGMKVLLMIKEKEAKKAGAEQVAAL